MWSYRIGTSASRGGGGGSGDGFGGSPMGSTSYVGRDAFDSLGMICFDAGVLHSNESVRVGGHASGAWCAHHRRTVAGDGKPQDSTLSIRTLSGVQQVRLSWARTERSPFVRENRAHVRSGRDSPSGCDHAGGAVCNGCGPAATPNVAWNRFEPTPMRVEELDYDLPADRIATRPMEPRDAARMMVVSHEGELIEHAQVRNLPRFLRSGDGLVFNDTAVCPARLIGRRTDTGGRVEGLFLESTDERRWRCLLKSNGKLRPGQMIELLGPDEEPTGDRLELLERDEEAWLVRSFSDDPTDVILERSGRTPLPPYILRARESGEPEAAIDASDRAWYQTVYADLARRRSVAAPTAGLHFTDELLKAIDAHGVHRAQVTLHVGAGTFQPIKTDTVEAHAMHEEWFEVTGSALRAIRAIRADGGRVIAVGTTTVRTLESIPAERLENPRDFAASTRLLISPPHSFRVVDGLLTNFHLPRSTLLALVGAMIGLDRLKSLYAEAVRAGYRFYSYGDAMLILPANRS